MQAEAEDTEMWTAGTGIISAKHGTRRERLGGTYDQQNSNELVVASGM